MSNLTMLEWAQKTARPNESGDRAYIDAEELFEECRRRDERLDRALMSHGITLATLERVVAERRALLGFVATAVRIGRRMQRDQVDRYIWAEQAWQWIDEHAPECEVPIEGVCIEKPEPPERWCVTCHDYYFGSTGALS